MGLGLTRELGRTDSPGRCRAAQRSLGEKGASSSGAANVWSGGRLKVRVRLGFGLGSGSTPTPTDLE